MNTLILEKVQANEDIKFDAFTRLLQNRVIFIDNLAVDQIAADIVATLFLLDRDESSKITIFLNCEGGDIRNVFMIYDAMRLLSSPVEVFCIGSAMHEAVLLLAAGTKGLRFLTKNSDVSISQVMNFFVSHSDLTNTKISHQKLNRDNNMFLKELAKCTGTSLKKLKKDTERQLFLTPEQAVKYGIADKVI